MQNYAKIQLIISDDASSDFSMKNIKSYCKKNAGLNIIDLQILQNDMNLGTVEHLKKIYPLCIGDILWILGADDILVKKDAVSCFVTEFNKNSNTMILTSQVALYDENLEVQKGYYLCSEGIELLKNGDAQQQLQRLSRECFIPAVGTCFRRILLSYTENLDDYYWLVEDWPFYVRLARNNIRIGYVDMIAVHHRHGGVSHGNKRAPQRKLLSQKYSGDLLSVYHYEISPFLYLLPRNARIHVKIRAFLRLVHHINCRPKYYIIGKKKRK